MHPLKKNSFLKKEPLEAGENFGLRRVDGHHFLDEGVVFKTALLADLNDRSQLRKPRWI